MKSLSYDQRRLRDQIADAVWAMLNVDTVQGEDGDDPMLKAIGDVLRGWVVYEKG